MNECNEKKDYRISASACEWMNITRKVGTKSKNEINERMNEMKVHTHIESKINVCAHWFMNLIYFSFLVYIFGVCIIKDLKKKNVQQQQ